MTIVDWIDLFTRECYVNILVESIKYCQKNKGLEVYAPAAARILRVALNSIIET